MTENKEAVRTQKDSHMENGFTPIRDCYPCWGRGWTESMGFRYRCNNCQGGGVSPTWGLSDGSDLSKRKARGGHVA